MRAFLAIAAALCAQTGQCITEAELDSIEKTFDLNEVVVTGTRTAKTLKDSPMQTRIISSADNRRSDAPDLENLLEQELAGVEFSYAMNQQTNLNFAGFSGLGVLVLVDGERLAGETMDNVDYSRIPMHNVERIEITRGASSALYGSNATGGVINIITRQPEGGLTAQTGVHYGSHGEWRAEGSVGVNKGKFANRTDASFRRFGSYDVCQDPTDDCDYRRVYGQRIWNFSDRVSFRMNEGIKMLGRASYFFKERSANADEPERYRAFSGGLRGEWKVTGRAYLEASYGYDQYDKSDFIKAHGLDIRDYSNVQHTVKALYNHDFREKDILTVGADWMREVLESYQFADGERRHQYVTDMYAQYDCEVTEALEAVAALRGDWYSDKDMKCVTPKVSVRYRCGALTLRASGAGGFRAPTLKERYMEFNMADIFDIHGNADLKAEKSWNFNVSGEYTWRNYYFTAGGNYNAIRDKIGTSGLIYAADREPYIEYVNVERLRVFGIDATVKGRWRNGITATLSYNFTHEEYAKGSWSQYCPARPHSLNGRVAWNKSWKTGWQTDVSLSGRFLSGITYSRMEPGTANGSAEITNPAYTMWKLQLSQWIGDHVQLSAAVDNLLNYRPEVYSLNTPVTDGTTFLVGVNVSW